jgi:lipoyl-dependent peroxiredoxin
VPRVERKADVLWEGDVARGHGTVRLGTGALDEFQVSLPTRIGDPAGKTSPEELVAAAHASCFAMALSNELSSAGTPPERLEASATVVLDEVGDAHRVTTVDLSVRGWVPGIDDATFQAAARAADEGCPISNLLRGGAEIRLDARLENQS